MKFISILTLSMTLLCSVFAELTLEYKTADESLVIAGVENKKPFAIQNGKKKFLPITGVFEINGSLEDIAKHAYFPLLYSQELVAADRKSDELNISNDFQFKTCISLGTLKTFQVFNQTCSHSPFFSHLKSTWDKEISNDTMLIFAWIKPSQSKHRATRFTSINEKVFKCIEERNTKIITKYCSEERVIPVVLLFSNEGQFYSLIQDSNLEKWIKVVPHLIRDNESEISEIKDLEENFFDANLLHWATLFNSSKCLNYLISKKVNINAKAQSKTTALHIAAQVGNNEAASILLDNGAKNSMKDKNGNTPLHYVSALGHKSIAELLLQHKTKKNLKNNKSETPMFLAGKRDNAAMIQFLEKEGVKFKFTKQHLQLLLLTAIKRNELDTIEYLISKGAKADKDTFGIKPIFAAAEYATGDIIKELIKNGADVNTKGSNGVTPLIKASLKNFDAVKTLVEHGANVNQTSDSGFAALHTAIYKHQVEITQYLLDNGADPNIKNPNGTPLFWLATEVGNRIGLNELISAGAVCSMDEETAMPIMEYAFRHNIPEIVEITLAECLNADFKFNKDIPAYWVADYYDSEEIMTIMQRNGINPASIEKPNFVKSKDVRSQIKLISKKDINYPVRLQDKYGEFKAKIQCIIDYDGSVIFPKLISNPAEELNRKILNTVTAWKFKPLVLNQQPVRTQLIIPWNFVPQPEKEKIYEVAEIEFKPRPVRQVAPTYPSALKSAKVNGQVNVVFVVDEEGNVVEPRAESASHQEFIYPAIAAISLWKFSPGYVEGEKVKVRVRAPLVFKVH